ncbi:MAG: PD-(D/E)XK nuclease family protein [Chloroflexota bacterium]
MDKDIDLTKINVLLESMPSNGVGFEPTFLEIAGYPHLENVTSNILKFFFDSWAKHGFKTLFLEALLESVGQPVNPADLVVDSRPKREAYTDVKTRLDLVISTPTLLIGIENKLFHKVINDLIGYKEYLHSKAHGRKVICILLSLNPVTDLDLLDGFIPVTYATLFANVRRHLEHHVAQTNQRYTTFLLDFIQTVENLRKEYIMPDPKFRTWVAENQDDIENLLVKIEIFKSQLTSQVKALQSMIDIAKHANVDINITPMIYEPDVLAGDDFSMRRVLVYDFEIPDGLAFSVEASLSALEWNIDVVCREPTSLGSVQKFLKQAPLAPFKPMAYDWMRLEQAFDYNINKSEIAGRMQAMIDHVVATTQSQNQAGIV